MGAMLIRERYKVTRVLRAEENYALLEVVDIQDRETPQRLLNIYEGPLIWRYADIYDRMSSRRDYYGMFLSGESLVAAFDDARGRGIDQVFYKGDAWGWSARLEFAQALMHCALSMADLPPEVSCSALLSENLLTDADTREFHPRFMVRPMEAPDRRELTYLAADQLRKILRPRFSSVDAEIAFLEYLDQTAFSGIVPMYARWLEVRAQIQADYERLYQKNVIKRWIVLLLKNIGRKLKGKPR